ncbi:MAG: DUF5989 family protein [Planctomycetota bacterium]|jgi:hypothetical protein
MTDHDQQEHKSFEEATEEHRGGLISEFIGFMRDNAKWWLIPFVIVFALLGVLLLFSGSAAAPFIYTLF